MNSKINPQRSATIWSLCRPKKGWLIQLWKPMPMTCAALALSSAPDSRALSIQKKSIVPCFKALSPTCLNVDQVFALLDQAAGNDPQALRDVALAELLYGSGLRISESLNLDLQD